MVKKLRKVLIIGVVLVMSLGILCACNNDESDEEFSQEGVVFYENVTKLMQEDFLSQNRTYGVYYFVKEYDEKTDSEVERVYREENAPKTRSIIIDNEQQFQSIFKENTFEVDFETEILLVHMFAQGNSRPAKLKNIENVDGNLIVSYYIQPAKPGINDASMPGQSSIAIKIDKDDIKTVEFRLIE